MVLEATVICCDNSEYMRNGDYSPTRLHAQQEAVQYISQLKTQSNAESEVGLLTMAGRRIDVLLTPSRDMGKLMTCLTQVRPEGRCNFLAGLKTAQLALKNRQNKKQRQRIIMFVGSPIEEKKEELVKLGQLLKKNTIAVDVINFGDENTENDNREKLMAFVNAVNTQDNSRLVNIPPGPHNLSDMVISSIMQDGAPAGFAPPAAAAAGGDGFVDPNLDPELAMALRLSMEEQKQSLEQQKRAAPAPAAPAAPSAPAPAPAPAPADVAMAEDEEALLAAAIAMSMQADAEMEDASAAAPAPDAAPSPAAPAPAPAPAAAQSGEDIAMALQDPEFMNSLLESLPGVNRDEIDVDSLLENLNADSGAKKPDEKKDGQGQ